MRLKSLVAAAITMSLSVPAWAGHHGKSGIDPECHQVPEVSSNGALAAILVLVAIAAILWERRRRA